MTDESKNTEALQHLKARYFRLMDTKNWTGWRGLFSDGLVARVDTAISTRVSDGKTAPTSNGADAFVANTRAGIDRVRHRPSWTHARAPTAHAFYSNRSLGNGQHRAVPHGRLLHGYGHYHETHQIKDGGGQNATLRLTRTRLDFSGPGSA